MVYYLSSDDVGLVAEFLGDKIRVLVFSEPDLPMREFILSGKSKIVPLADARLFSSQEKLVAAIDEKQFMSESIQKQLRAYKGI